MSRALKVALLGCGNVGSEVYRLLGEQAGDLEARIGAPVEVTGVAVRRPGRARSVPVAPELITTDAVGLVSRPDVDIVVEVIGGIEPARSLLLTALKAGKAVVTANKALLAEDGMTLHDAARAAGADLYYEASVAGAIPLLRPLRDSLAGDAVRQVLGIVNGTTNYILDQMDTSGAGFEDALEEAQALGYAEPDPTADVEGFDAAAKAAILAGLAFHTRVAAADVHREGITGVTQADIASAQQLGHVVKLLAMSAGVTPVIPSRCTSAAPTRVWNARPARMAALAAASNPSTSAVGSASAYPSACASSSASVKLAPVVSILVRM